MTTPLVSVCICTYKRPSLLLKLLESLASQDFELSRLEIVVVDNDSEGSARDVVKGFVLNHQSISLIYQIEPISGISFARNRSVQMAKGEYIAFIDDDETASRNWISDLLLILQRCNADAVIGPVIPVFPNASKKWVVASGLFTRPRFSTGTLLQKDDGRAGNSMVRASAFKFRGPEFFKIQLAHSGGEDHDFFKSLVESGRKMVWCDTAEVFELVPLERQTMAYILKRSFRTSVMYWTGEFKSLTASTVFLKVFLGGVGGLAYMGVGCLRTPFGLHKAIPFFCKSMRAFGRVFAFLKYKPMGYGAAND